MDPSDTRDGSHPSHSIPDAAYPDDSSYRPGDSSPSLNPSQVAIPPSIVTTTSSSSPQQTYSTSHVSPFAPAYSNPPSPNSHATSPYSTTAAAPGLHPHDIPLSPPPPYDPAQPPSVYSPLEPVPAFQHAAPTPPESSHYAPSSTPWPQAAPSPNPYGSSAGSSVNGGGGAYKLGPVAAERARRKRKMQMCAVALCAVVLFVLALIIGILMGVVKVQWKGRDDDDDD
ncbi:hypothetical protein FZEAL_4534 [Fusarium zealandicum]|uniref:Uncharacterized protein n=1 Tax=Fusarium zealandicum TaxID=1053134 RepID=A0A8H4UMD5_9HYPO|nr:hypothetical protein FZEAL_4534 [Fusarium zealandicum]